MSETPRTDQWQKQYDDWADKSLFRPSTVMEDVPDGWDRCRELERELAAAKAERDALRADAERYRWLRVRHPGHRLEVRYWTGTWWEVVEQANLDAAIDAARKDPS
jgi:hypothetical protein